MIRIASTEYNPNARALEIYVSGCTRFCHGCHNSELQDYNRGVIWSEWLEKHIKKMYNPLVKRLWFLGGDVLCQEVESYHEMLEHFKHFDKEMWLWTGCEYKEIPSEFRVWDYFDVIKAGRYDCHSKGKSTYAIKTSAGSFKLNLSGTNQRIYVHKNLLLPD